MASNFGTTLSWGATAVWALSQSKTLAASKEHWASNPLARRQAARRGYRVLTLVDPVNVGRARASAMQGESPKKTETIQNLPAPDQISHLLVILLLIEVEPRFMAARNIHVKLQSVQVNLHQSLQRSAQKPVAFRQPFKFAERRLAPFHNGARGENALERFDDHCFALIHAEGGDLHDENVSVFIHDQSAQKIALSIDDAKRGGPGQSRCRSSSAARMRSTKNALLTSTRSGAITLTWILDFEL